MTMRQDSLIWWNNKKNEYPFHALTTTKVNPIDISIRIYGHHASVVLANGFRLWGFKSNRERNMFNRKYEEL